MSQIILYDILARPERGEHVSWSPAVWRTRLALNYKQIPYQTKWMRISEVTPTLSKEGVPPGEPNGAGKLYHVPTIRMPDEKGGGFFTDSTMIARELDKLYPEPLLHTDSETLPRLEAILASAGMFPIRAAMAPLTPKYLLDYESIPYYRENLKKLNVDVDQEADFDNALEKGRPAIEQMNQLLTETPGPFVLGDEPSHTDFILVGIMQFIRRASEEAFQKFVGSSEPLQILYKASEQWTHKVD